VVTDEPDYVSGGGGSQGSVVPERWLWRGLCGAQYEIPDHDG